jgi:hypothetical protein
MKTSECPGGKDRHQQCTETRRASANLNTPPMVLPPAQGVPVTMRLSISKNVPTTQSSSGKSNTVDCVVR